MRSKSSRSICWRPPRMRVLVMVGNPSETMKCGSIFVGAEACGQQLFIFVAAGNADNHGLRAQPGQIHGHVGGAAGLLVLMHAAHHGHGRFRGDAPHLAPDVFVEHDVADDEQALVGPFMLDVVDYPVQLSYHRAPLLCGIAGICNPADVCMVAIITGWPTPQTAHWQRNLRTVFLDRDGVLNEKLREGTMGRFVE